MLKKVTNSGIIINQSGIHSPDVSHKRGNIAPFVTYKIETPLTRPVIRSYQGLQIQYRSPHYQKQPRYCAWGKK